MPLLDLGREDWLSIWLTLWTAAVAVITILPPGLAVAWLLARKQWPGKSLVETVIALGVMSFPLLVRSLRTAFEEVPVRLENVASTLGRSPWNVFWTITLPLARRGVAAGLVLSFARALGEFGATIMLAGLISGKTSTLSLSIYQHVQTGNDTQAMKLLAVCLLIAFVALWISEKLSPRKHRP